MLESGVMAQDRYDAIVNAPEGAWYAPYQRESRDKHDRVQEVIKRLKGSERRKIPPVQSSIAMHLEILLDLLLAVPRGEAGAGLRGQRRVHV